MKRSAVRSVAPALALALAALLPLRLAAAGAEEAVFTGVSRVVAIGDIHGDHDKLLAALRLCKVVDAKGRWSAGKAHLVQTGDVLDRGPDSRKAMDLLMRLEGEARRAGGRVHALLGNHEVMNVQGDLRYVSDGEFASFGDGPRGTPVGAPPMGTFPGHRAAFAPTGPYGRWLLGHNAVINIDGTLFLHGGLSARYAAKDLKEINDAIRRELQAGGAMPGTGVSGDQEGPLWYRGLALAGADDALRAQIEPVLAAQKARRMVLGHTIQEDGNISLRLGDRLALIDVGMSRATRDKAPTCLQIERKGPGKEQVTAIR